MSADVCPAFPPPPASQLHLGPPSVTGRRVVSLPHPCHLADLSAASSAEKSRCSGLAQGPWFSRQLMIFRYFLCVPLSAKGSSQTTCTPWALLGRRGARAKADLALDVSSGRGARVPGRPVPWGSAASRDWEAQPLGHLVLGVDPAPLTPSESSQSPELTWACLERNSWSNSALQSKCEREKRGAAA